MLNMLIDGIVIVYGWGQTGNLLLHATESTRTSKNVLTNRGSVKLSTAHSLHSSSHSLEVREKLPLSVIRGLPPCSPPNMTSPTAPPLPGSDVLSHFPSYDHPSGVLEVLDLLLATR